MAPTVLAAPAARHGRALPSGAMVAVTRAQRWAAVLATGSVLLVGCALAESDANVVAQRSDRTITTTAPEPSGTEPVSDRQDTVGDPAPTSTMRRRRRVAGRTAGGRLLRPGRRRGRGRGHGDALRGAGGTPGAVLRGDARRAGRPTARRVELAHGDHAERTGRRHQPARRIRSLLRMRHAGVRDGTGHRGDVLPARRRRGGRCRRPRRAPAHDDARTHPRVRAGARIAARRRVERRRTARPTTTAWGASRPMRTCGRGSSSSGRRTNSNDSPPTVRPTTSATPRSGAGTIPPTRARMPRCIRRRTSPRRSRRTCTTSTSILRSPTSSRSSTATPSSWRSGRTPASLGLSGIEADFEGCGS